MGKGVEEGGGGLPFVSLPSIVLFLLPLDAGDARRPTPVDGVADVVVPDAGFRVGQQVVEGARALHRVEAAVDGQVGEVRLGAAQEAAALGFHRRQKVVHLIRKRKQPVK